MCTSTDSSQDERQIAQTVLMVRPAAFSGNAETLESNHFQSSESTDGEAARAARSEFDALVARLRAAGVEVLVIRDTPAPAKPDAVFPNNWFSTHADGTVVLYPMLAPSRRVERRADLIERLSEAGFKSARIIDLSEWERRGLYLEGTGSLVLDRVNRIAYACRSVRTAEDVLSAFAQQLGYELVMFNANDRSGRAIYHTNVIMSVGQRFAAVCCEALSAADCERVPGKLAATGHEVIDLDRSQISQFAGNLLELATPGGSIVAMSAAAAGVLKAGQVQQIERLAGPIVSSPIPTIERYGGGSVRCMLAEIHLSRAS